MISHRTRAVLLVAAAALAAGGVGVVTAQNAPPPDAEPVAEAPAAPAQPSAAEAPPTIDDLAAAEAPPSADAPPVPVVRAEDDARPRPRPRRAPQATRQAQADAQEGEEAAPASDAPAFPRPRFATAVIQGLDKTTARTIRFEAQVGQPLRYEGLIVTVRACERTRPEEPREDAAAYLEVFAQPRNTRSRAVQARQVYRGWTFAQSPAVNPFGHPLYVLWLVECRGRSMPAATPRPAQTRASVDAAPRA